MADPGSTTEPTLVRALGVRALAATMFNVMIGSGIFVLPATAAALLGARAPLAYVVCALALGLIVLCFAEAGSRVSLTGGPYAYVEVAFGPFVGFLAGVLLWLLGSFATAAVSSALVGSAAVFWAPLARTVPRAAFLVLVFGILAVVNIRGVRQGTQVIEVVTVAKLLPLVLLVVAGVVVATGAIPLGAAARAAPAPDVMAHGGFGRTVIVLVFAFAGIESALVPSGEVRDPARTVPRALAIAMIVVTALYVALQLVAQHVLGVGGLAAAKEAPLAATATRIAGAAGGMIVAAGAVVAMLGHVSGMTLATPRALYVFGRNGLLPLVSPLVGSIHPRYRTPHVAIALQAAIACVLAVTSRFAALAVIANVAVLTLYLLCCIAVLELRRRDVRQGGIPFRVPGGPVVPILATGVILWILAQATRHEIDVVLGVLAGASLLFATTMPRRRAVANAE